MTVVDIEYAAVLLLGLGMCMRNTSAKFSRDTALGGAGAITTGAIGAPPTRQATLHKLMQYRSCACPDIRIASTVEPSDGS